jgi:hypothetical protein
LNEITISDLTSLADPDSIRVSGTTDNHPARINDLTIDLIPNKYSALSDTSDTDSDSGDEEEDEEPASLKAAKNALDTVVAKIKEVDERRSSAHKELSLVEKYASTVASSTASTTIPNPEMMKDTLNLYNEQRVNLFKAVTTLDSSWLELDKEKAKKKKIHDKEKRVFEKATRAKVEAREKKKADKEEKKREKMENKPQKSSHVHRVRITIELPSSDVTTQESNADVEVFQEATLTLTYTTASASWTPHYDLRLDTTNPSLSSLTYRAHFTNRTYETWSQAAITLSTSQASFGGLKEKIPQMEGWRVTLEKKWNTVATANGENGLYSLAEVKAKQEAEQKEYGIDIVRDQLREIGSISKKGGAKGGSVKWKQGSTPTSFPSFGSSAPSAPPLRSMRLSQSVTEENEDGDEEMRFDYEDGATLTPSARAMQHSLAGSDTYG